MSNLCFDPSGRTNGTVHSSKSMRVTFSPFSSTSSRLPLLVTTMWFHSPAGFIAFFVGGHGAKRWPSERWIDLASRVAADGGRVALFAGPEEAASVPALRSALDGRAVVVEPQPLRTFAAVLGAAALVVTPDSGPMHLAVAVGTPVVAVLASRGSTFFRPRGAADVALVEPRVDDVYAALRAHPLYESLRAGSSSAADGAAARSAAG